MEDTIEADGGSARFAEARYELDALGDLIPDAACFVGGGFARWSDLVVGEDEGIEGDDLAVIVEDVEREFTWDECRNGAADGNVLLAS